MLMLVCGLLLFLVTHSVRIFADDWRGRVIARVGPNAWKGMVSVLALAGVVLIAEGFGQTRADPLVLWVPPLWTRHLAGLLMLLAFVLLTAAYLPGTRIKSWVGHPMVAAVKTWALAHLLANGQLAHVLLFGGLLVWAVLDFVASRRRDRQLGLRPPPGSAGRDAAAVVVGAIAWWLFARYGHVWLIGVSPFGG